VLRIFAESSEKWYVNSQSEQFKTFLYMLEEMEKLLIKPKRQEEEFEKLNDINSIKSGDTKSQISVAYDEEEDNS